MLNTLIAKCPLGRDRRLAYPQGDQIRITSMWGSGTLIYATDDGWLGIKLDGEDRIDEYPHEHVSIEASLRA